MLLCLGPPDEYRRRTGLSCSTASSTLWVPRSRFSRTTTSACPTGCPTPSLCSSCCKRTSSRRLGAPTMPGCDPLPLGASFPPTPPACMDASSPAPVEAGDAAVRLKNEVNVPALPPKKLLHSQPGNSGQDPHLYGKPLMRRDPPVKMVQYYCLKDI